MEANKLKNYDDLEIAWQQDERLELINGDISQRTAPRAEHSIAQTELSAELTPYRRGSGTGGWWIATEISVRYNEHQCPSHDLAGWRKERVPEKPRGVMDIAPDWVCEITSPGHEKRDLLDKLLLLQAQRVPYYWIISPEDHTLLAYKLVEDKYALIETINEVVGRVRIEPFVEVEFDLSYVFG